MRVVVRAHRTLSAIAALVAAVALGSASACGGNDAASTTTSSSASGSGGGTGSGGAGGGVPEVDPHLFDCTAKHLPARVDTVSGACAVDPLCKTRLVSGHRGAGGPLGVLAPEDTLAAVRAAIAIGADFVETDPRPTKDGVLVNMHDTTVDRTTDGHGSVDQMTFAELEKLHLLADAFPGDFSCEKVPTIAQLLATAKGRVHVLLDGNKTDRVDLFVDAVHQTGTLADAIFDTDDPNKIDAALALEPKLLTMIRVASVDELNQELAHFAAHPPVIVEIESGAPMPDVIDAIHAAKNRALTDVFPGDLAAGFDGDFTVYQDWIDQGFDVLQTERPDLVLKALGRWPPKAQ